MKTLGGFLGGQKYVHKGFLYKFAVYIDETEEGDGKDKDDVNKKLIGRDTGKLRFIFVVNCDKGYDYVLRKVAGHELKTLSQICNFSSTYRCFCDRV